MMNCLYGTEGQQHLLDFLQHDFKNPIAHTGRGISYGPVQDYHCRAATVILDNSYSSKIDLITKNAAVLSWSEGYVFQHNPTTEEDETSDPEYFQKLFIQKEKHFNPEWNLARNLKESLIDVGGAYTSMFAYLTHNTRLFIYLNNSTDSNEDAFKLYFVVNDCYTFLYWTTNICEENTFRTHFKSSVIREIEMDRDSLILLQPVYILNKWRRWSSYRDYPYIDKMSKFIKKLMV